MLHLSYLIKHLRIDFGNRKTNLTNEKRKRKDSILKIET